MKEKQAEGHRLHSTTGVAGRSGALQTYSFNPCRGNDKKAGRITP
jgi:hypothetical protein